jgi:ribonuclease inhibitor
MKTIILEGSQLADLPAVYDALERQLGLPSWFGRNLDALHDALTGMVKGPVEIVWRDAERSRRAMGDDFARIVAILRQATSERADIRVVFQ